MQHLGEGDGSLYRELLLQLINPENRSAAEDWVDRASLKNAGGAVER